MPNTGSVTGSGAQGAGAWVNGPTDRGDAALASAARAAGSSNGTAFAVRDAQVLTGRLNVTNINGGTVTAKLQGTVDGTNWDDIGAWPQKSANGTHAKTFDVRGYAQARWAWTVATATVTFQIDQVTQTGR